jgi:hypothetical protein
MRVRLSFYPCSVQLKFLFTENSFRLCKANEEVQIFQQKQYKLFNLEKYTNFRERSTASKKGLNITWILFG